MKTILQSVLVQCYRNKRPVYNRVCGHTGIDLRYRYESLPSPISGVVTGYYEQNQMGNVLYVKDRWSNTHVFAHLSSVNFLVGQEVNRGEVLGTTGNTGSVTSGPHLHYEVVTPLPRMTKDLVMVRWLPGAKGFNTDPIVYLKELYDFYKVPYDNIKNK